MTATTRITAGAWRGRAVDTPGGRDVRPTQAMVRQALFNVLGPKIAGARVVDLFAGAGTVSFEALSRGAAGAVAVEKNPAMVAMIQATAERLGCTDRCRPVRSDVLGWLRRRPSEVTEASVIFVDPPYNDPIIDEVIELLGRQGPALVVCEHHARRELPASSGSLRLQRTLRYGGTALSLLHKVED
jgi:16S rRNA (guanine966-N2)-methyltransferase